MRALIVVDIQNDFLPGGALAVPGGDEVVPIVDRLLPCFEHVVATQDWHPPDHGSFAIEHPGRKVGETILLDGLEQILWPPHCVQGTRGADFAPGLDTSHFDAIFRTGVDPRVDSYSTFFDNARRRSTGLAEHLRARGIGEVWICGLATDYCVLYSVRDARLLDLETRVIRDACRAIDRVPGDGARAFAEMERLGARLVTSDEVLGAGAHP